MSIDLDVGSVINITHFTHVTPSAQFSYKCPKGKVFVAVLIGIADKADPKAFDPEAALHALGWTHQVGTVPTAVPTHRAGHE